MRWSTDNVRNALLHEERDVRDAAMLYFLDSSLADVRVMETTIQAIQQYGWQSAFSLDLLPNDFPQNRETVDWCLAELAREEAAEADQWTKYCQALSGLLAQADRSLLVAAGLAERQPPGLDARVQEYLSERLAATTTDLATGWEAVREYCRKEASGAGDLPQPLLLLESLAELGDSVSERVQAALSEPFDAQDREQANWQICLVLLAGELRRPELVPPLVERLSIDAEWLNEECMFALARIGNDAVVSLIEERLLEESEQFQFYAAGVLERIHSERSVEACVALTAAIGEKDSHDVRLSLAQALLGSFASEGIEPARQLILAGPMDESLIELRSTLLTVSKALEIDFPERADWEQEQRDDEAYRRQFQVPSVEYVDASGGFVESKPLAPVRRISASPARFRLPPRVRLPSNSATNPFRVGRNDPCPCGSGKKYKKCCLPKQRAGRR